MAANEWPPVFTHHEIEDDSIAVALYSIRPHTSQVAWLLALSTPTL
jgi:hypothetical protein